MPENEPCIFGTAESANNIVLNMIDALYIYHTQIINKLNLIEISLQHLISIQPPGGNIDYTFNFPAHDIIQDVIKSEELFSEIESKIEGFPSPRGEYFIEYSETKGSTYSNGEEEI